jgi:hypothetical protein
VGESKTGKALEACFGPAQPCVKARALAFDWWIRRANTPGRGGLDDDGEGGRQRTHVLVFFWALAEEAMALELE